MFYTRGPIFGFLKLFQVAIVTRGVIFRSVILMLGVNKLLAMPKDISGLHPIVLGEKFFRLISRSIVLQLRGPFQEHLSPISLEYQPLEAMRPSLLAFEPFSTYTLIGS
jgi:hypothetical protein